MGKFASATFEAFLKEIPTLSGHRPDFFEAKQRMLSRAQATGTVEAYSLQGSALMSQPTEMYLAILEEAQERVARGGSESRIGLSDGRIKVNYDPHQEEIKTVLVSSVLQHLENRRMTTMTFAVSVAACIAAVIAIFK